MAKTHKFLGKDVEEKSPHKFPGVECEDFGLGVVGVISIAEINFSVFNFDKPVI